MKTLEFAFVAYPVTDIRKSRDFYERILGFKTATIWGDDNQGWVEYEIGPHTLAITNFGADWKPSGQGPAVALEVEDYDASIAEIKAQGALFHMETTTTPVCRFALIQDPDGNRLFIHKRKA
jgi:predicted enzyme related to lactoylglutathione lyase